MAIHYRKAAAADGTALLEYIKTVGGESDNLTFGPEGIPLTVEQEQRILANLENSPHSVMLLALDGDRIVGNATIEGTGNPRFRHRRNLAICVRKSHWGQGIGTGLMEGVIRFCRQTGGEVICLEVRSDNTRAKALYQKFGFRHSGTCEKFFRIRDQYFAADLMTLYL